MWAQNTKYFGDWDFEKLILASSLMGWVISELHKKWLLNFGFSVENLESESGS